jgi:alpha-galactosidase
VTRDGITLAARLEHVDRGVVVRSRVVNRGGTPIRLEAAWFALATGLDASRRTRMFKHGYQSWSASRAVAVGSGSASRAVAAGSGDASRTVDAGDAAPSQKRGNLVAINHQSETTRPPDAPEAATSELFTIVEADGAGERMLAGFIGGATALTTLTMLAPDTICARAILDGVTLAPGASRELEPLYFASADESAARLAARWAAMIGAAMHARIDAPYQRGWCSWYHYFHAVTEDAMRANIKALAAMRSEFPLEVVQLDDGFQSALGDWDSTNAKFPGGLKLLADEIRAAGFRAGIWSAPFLAARDSRLMREHPDWFIMHSSGQPLRAGYNPNWTTSQDAFAYALDAGNPEFRAHTEQLFAKLVHEFGYSYLKLDFLYAAAAQGIRHDMSLTRAETLRAGLEAIRRGAGADTFLLGCGCPLGPAIGIVDGMRIGPDVAPFWDARAGASEPATAAALDAIVARSFMHRRLWLNDPDCLMLRARQTSLTAEERGALAATIAASGGMLLISDDMALLEREAGALYRAVADLGAEADADAPHEAVLALDLMTSGAMRGLVEPLRDETLAMLLNLGAEAERIRLADLRLGPGKMTLVDFGSAEHPLGDLIEIPPHAARIIRIRS